MKLPNGDRAIVDIRKLSEYCLDLHHSYGCHKARVFASVLGLTAEHAEELRQLLLANAAAGDAEPRHVDQHGEHYVLDFDIARGDRSGSIRSLWVIPHGEQVPRLVSCFVRRTRRQGQNG